MRLDAPSARRRFETARVARLATVTEDGTPHVIPVCFVTSGEVVYSAVDDKPKNTRELQRLSNISANAAVSLLVDEYVDDDWSRLWWARADGQARLVDDQGERVNAVTQLREKYPQYRTHGLGDAVIAVDVSRWTGWTSA